MEKDQEPSEQLCTSQPTHPPRVVAAQRAAPAPGQPQPRAEAPGPGPGAPSARPGRRGREHNPTRARRPCRGR
eukprot:3075898-Alexandrium_andersonii.AAC.1